MKRNNIFLLILIAIGVSYADGEDYAYVMENVFHRSTTHGTYRLRFSQ